MRAPPFQVTWNVSLGGRAQDLRATKISARAAACLGVVYRPFNLSAKCPGGTPLAKVRRAREVCQSHWHRQKKAPADARAFRLRATLRSLPIRDAVLADQCSKDLDTRHHGSKIAMLAPDNPKRAIRLPPDRILRQSSNPRLVLLAFGKRQCQTGHLVRVVRTRYSAKAFDV